MGAIDLESIDTAATKTEVSPETAVIDETPKETKETIPEKSSGPVKTVEKPVKEEEPFISVGEKKFSKEQAIENLEKIGRYQGDRDRTEAALERVIAQMQRAGFTVDNNLNVVPVQQRPPMPNKQELTMLAAAGDNEALNKLLEIQGEEISNRVYGNLQKAEVQKGILENVKKEYPDFYKDGQPNLDSPLSKEATKIIEQYPQFGQVEYLPVVAKMAEANLLKNNFKNLEQSIKDKTHQKLAQSASQSVGTPGTTPSTGEEGMYSDEQLAFAKKLGLDSERLQKVIKRAQEKGGYEI